MTELKRDGNYLFYGDNLDVLRRYIPKESVDLVYLDPPFKSNQDYNVLFEEKDGEQSAAQILAFEDTWRWDQSAVSAYHDVLNHGGKTAEAIKAFKSFLGTSDMMAYLAMMAPRLLELRRVMKPTASIYLHCDPTASHYLKMLMDAVFGAANFRNEIVWYYYNKIHDRRKKLFPRASDTIFFYVKDVNQAFTYHQLKEMRPEPVKQLLRKKVEGKMVNVKDEAGHVVYRVKEDRTLDNVWRIPCLQPASTERLGYQTQKPQALLERIIQASSNPKDTVLDPFCGCGTTVAAAQKLGRRWIGIDITHLAISLIKHRLYTTYKDFPKKKRPKYEVIGEPVDESGARELADANKYQFQYWALGLVGARPSEQRKGADKGIDGKLYFHDESERGKTKSVVISVKGGHVQVSHIRDLRGVIEREEAQIGVLITLNEPTRDMKKEAVEAGVYTSPGIARSKHPRIQILTIEELLKGASIDLPTTGIGNNTLKPAPKANRGKEEGQESERIEWDI